jgi:hypothetical protein
MISALTDNQLMALRFSRGDCMHRSPGFRPLTSRQDQNLLVALMLIERRDGWFQITERGRDYLARVDAETLAEHGDDNARSE